MNKKIRYMKFLKLARIETSEAEILHDCTVFNAEAEYINKKLKFYSLSVQIFENFHRQNRRGAPQQGPLLPER